MASAVESASTGERASQSPRPSPSESGESSPLACILEGPAPSTPTRPGVHPPDALIGSRGGDWEAGELGSFGWREGDTVAEGTGPPAIVPPEVTYRSTAHTGQLHVALSEPVPIEAWGIILFPWSAYDDDPPEDATAEEWAGSHVEPGDALCLTTGGPGDFSLTVKLDFGAENHAAYRWRVIVPDE